MYYKLENKEVIKVDSAFEWAKNFREKNRIVAQTAFGKIKVSTVFLGLDHNFSGQGKPLVFETMIFGGNIDYQVRYSTYEEAELGHEEACSMIKKQNLLE